jgi:hypothetical protein
MPRKTAKSFAEVAFIEAVARRARVELAVQLPTPDGRSRLRSRFLGFAADLTGPHPAASGEPPQESPTRPLVIDVPEGIELVDAAGYYASNRSQQPRFAREDRGPAQRGGEFETVLHRHGFVFASMPDEARRRVFGHLEFVRQLAHQIG